MEPEEVFEKSLATVCVCLGLFFTVNALIDYFGTGDCK